MKKLLTFVMILLLCGAIGALAQDDLPTRAELTDGVNYIPVAGAVCARGTPYQFAVRTGDPDKLMIYFQGGGACWSDRTCRVEDSRFDDSTDTGELSGAAVGAFDRDNPDNPIADYSVVVVMYCTADVHVGAADVRYGAADTRYTINHHGAANAIAVLDWTFANYPNPDHLIITGSSAGAYGAIYHAPRILSQYPGVPALVFGDAGIGVTPEAWQGVDNWNGGANQPDAMPPTVEGAVNDFTYSDDLYATASASFPDVIFAEYTSAADSNQVGNYFLQFGVPGQWAPNARAHLETRSALANFRYYLAWGDTHTILPTDLFYTMQVNGVRFVDWFAALVAGEPVETVACQACESES
ncbi:MAG: pectin acetylesterase-family hydrolase [Chloroflexota bacterium]|nr:pectin acetylesterase-family hydrolase [Chloroflexota bacterium]